MMTYRKFLSFLVPGFNQPAVKLLLIMISLAFYAVSLDVMNSLVMIIKRRLNHLISNLGNEEPPGGEQG
ncbi:MAG: hypothetical protein WBC88_05000 [Candidatus Zixiibacteriota bacterium]